MGISSIWAIPLLLTLCFCSQPPERSWANHILIPNSVVAQNFPRRLHHLLEPPLDTSSLLAVSNCRRLTQANKSPNQGEAQWMMIEICPWASRARQLPKRGLAHPTTSVSHSGGAGKLLESWIGGGSRREESVGNAARLQQRGAKARCGGLTLRLQLAPALREDRQSMAVCRWPPTRRSPWPRT